MILLAGDVELNPGRVRCPCTTCSKPVKRNQCGLLCDDCERWTHATCCGINETEYERLVLAEEEKWLCEACKSSECTRCPAPNHYYGINLTCSI